MKYKCTTCNKEIERIHEFPIMSCFDCKNKRKTKCQHKRYFAMKGSLTKTSNRNTV